MVIELRLDKVSQGGKITRAVSIFHAFRFRSCSAGVGQSDQIILLPNLRLQAIPAVVSMISIVFQSLQNRLVELPTQLALRSICVCIDYQWCSWVCLAIAVKERKEFGVNNNGICVGMIKYVSYIFVLQAVIDCCGLTLVQHWVTVISIIPTLTAPAAAMPNIDSKNAGVLGQSMPTLLYS